jgi:hypothetical protein
MLAIISSYSGAIIGVSLSVVDGLDGVTYVPICNPETYYTLSEDPTACGRYCVQNTPTHTIVPKPIPKPGAGQQLHNSTSNADVSIIYNPSNGQLTLDSTLPEVSVYFVYPTTNMLIVYTLSSTSQEHITPTQLNLLRTCSVWSNFHQLTTYSTNI